MRDKHTEWLQHLEAHVEPMIQQRLENNLLAADASGFLSMNFDKELLSLFAEVHYWEGRFISLEVSRRGSE